MKADPALVWYFCDSAAELGMRAAPINGDGAAVTGWPEQRWPSQRMCNAARKWRAIRGALFQLSEQLQSVLECAYSAQGLTVQERFEHDLAAPLIAVALSRMRRATPADQRALRAFIERAPALLEAAHSAFHIAYGPPEPRSRPAARRARVQRWLDEEGLRV